ncbi:MAG TPA: FHA domain-containing protein [Myxococcota bacterium]|nr:FHA domain-containing protein [Myxococcota bacterium]
MIRASPEGFTAVDLGSANGTLLNGTPLAEPTLLASGDILELAGDTRFVFEQDEDEGDTGTDRKGTLLVLAFATIAWRWRKSDAVFDQAAATAAAGLKADWSGAKTKLQSAAGLLLSNGRLGDRLSAELGRPVDLPTVFRNAVERSRSPSCHPQ